MSFSTNKQTKDNGGRLENWCGSVDSRLITILFLANHTHKHMHDDW